MAYLMTHQNEDGSWGTFESARPWEVYLGTVASFRAFRDATTALVLMALQEPSRTDPTVRAALDRGLAFLLATPPVARADAGTFYDTWTHTYLVQALSVLSRDDRFADRRDLMTPVVLREIAALEQRQGADGGWGYYDFNFVVPTPSGEESTSFNTAAALIALHEADLAAFPVREQTIADGLACLQRLRLPSGAYVYGTYAQFAPDALYNWVKGSLGRSQCCNLALRLRAPESIDVNDLRTGFDNLRTEHHFIEIGKGRPYPHEAWYYTAGYYFLFGHYYASRVIDFLDPADRPARRDWLAQTMVRLQDPDGSWFDFPLYGYHKPYGTAFALLTLQRCADLAHATTPSIAAQPHPDPIASR